MGTCTEVYYLVWGSIHVDIISTEGFGCSFFIWDATVGGSCLVMLMFLTLEPRASTKIRYRKTYVSAAFL